MVASGNIAGNSIYALGNYLGSLPTAIRVWLASFEGGVTSILFLPIAEMFRASPVA